MLICFNLYQMKETTTIAQKMAELSKFTKYRYALNQIKKSAMRGKRETTVITANCDAQAVQRLEAEGFTLKPIDNGNYKAYKISW